MTWDRIVAGIRNLLIGARFIERPDFVALPVDDHPIDDEISIGVLYVVQSGSHQKWAYFRCPTDADEVIQLSLMANRRPRWAVKIDWLGRPTLNPSVRQTSGSFAHFWLRGGKIILCADSGHSGYSHQDW